MSAPIHLPELNRVHRANCLDFLQLLPAESVDAVITDPPYGTASMTKVQKRGNNELVAFNLTWDASIPYAWIPMAARAMKPGAAGYIFTDAKAPGKLWSFLRKLGLKPLQNFYWRKLNPPPQPRKNFCSAIEVAVFFRKPGPVHCWLGGATTHNVFECGLAAGNERTSHPTQKPTALMEHLVKLVSPLGGIVLDPFGGSGSTGISAQRNGRSFWSCELDPIFVGEANAWLDAERLGRKRTDPISQNSLF